MSFQKLTQEERDKFVQALNTCDRAFIHDLAELLKGLDFSNLSPEDREEMKRRLSAVTYFYSYPPCDEISDVVFEKVPPFPLVRQSPKAAGYDLHSCSKTVVLKPNQTHMFSTGLKLEHMRDDLAGFIYPRSSLGRKGLRLVNGTGVIDADFTGEIKVGLHNYSDQEIEVKFGDRIAQLVFQTLPKVAIKYSREQTYFYAPFTSKARDASGWGGSGASVQLDDDLKQVMDKLEQLLDQ